MYSQLFDDEWSEAFEVFKPKTEDEDDDIFPDTLYMLQDLLTVWTISFFNLEQRVLENYKAIRF